MASSGRQRTEREKHRRDRKSSQKEGRTQRDHLRQEVDDLVRGVCGGFLFGVPMLYTMEMWWIGSSVSPLRLFAVLLITLLCTYLLSSTAGFRKSQATTWREALVDAVEAIALGIVCAFIMLVVIQQVTFDTQISETIGKVVFESVPFSLGIALANQFLYDSDNSPDSDEASASQNSDSQRFTPDDNLNETISDIGATLLGAIIIAFSIAPTDEVTVLVAAVTGPWLLLTVLISLLLSYGIVFQANFARQKQRRSQKGLFQGPLSETVFSYVLSLLAAALMLSFFRKIDPTAPLDLAFRQVLILGLPATIGGAAGRLTV